MDYAFTKSGNIIAKDSKILGAKYIVNQGKSYIGHSTLIHGDRNNDKPVISWGQYVILSDGATLKPAERKSKFYPIIIGHHVSIGKNSTVEAASIGSNVIIGDNVKIGKFAIIKDCVVVPDMANIPAYAVIGPSTKVIALGQYENLPESAEEAIGDYCETTLAGITIEVPEF